MMLATELAVLDHDDGSCCWSPTRSPGGCRADAMATAYDQAVARLER